MSDEKFKPGELVQLKAGGPQMVVEEWIGRNEVYKCSWFSGAKHNREFFKEAAIQPFTEDIE